MVLLYPYTFEFTGREIDFLQNLFRLAEFHPLANPGGYWVPEPDLESDESRRKIESIKMSFALTEKQLAKRAAEVKAAEEASVVEKNPAESSQQVPAS